MVEDWKEAYRWFSVQITALLAVLPFVWASLPDDVKAYVPDEWRPFIVSAVALGVIVGRLKDQPGRTGRAQGPKGGDHA
ncbi:hypothetical protein [Paracoccus phage vB_PmaS-R3]|uniref:Holin n=1 Tax=Paracoccus phage vB_PmaS-R3 TaxID=2494563 RepID=A0A0B5A601_9CAUD|nr:holin [Paracoccus phage vB_PmaS-R3]AJD83155.1 hypothetical protein [Paracoccus phage vB_PmaS-R3]